MPSYHIQIDTADGERFKLLEKELGLDPTFRSRSRWDGHDRRDFMLEASEEQIAIIRLSIPLTVFVNINKWTEENARLSSR